MNWNHLLLFLYVAMLIEYAFVFADTDIDTNTDVDIGYGVVNRDDLPLPPVDPLTPILPESYCSNPPGLSISPPSTTIGPPASEYYPPSPPASGSYTPSPPATSSSSYPTTPTPPFSFSTPYTPPTTTTTTTTPGSPAIYEPTPTLNPPSGSGSGSGELSPPTFAFPSPTGIIPAPPLFEPPIVYPPPTQSPPVHSPGSALWCVAKPSVPDPIIQEAMNYACGSGADCESLQPNGECFKPDTLFAHASYAFNSYWQRTKVAGGTCEFGGSAMLVTVDPSYDGCHFIYF
ncbi:hypothetical protein LXL04_039344 [Taraxacum kok-saghyz]